MAAIEFAQHERRLVKKQKQLMSSLAERLETVCPADGVLLVNRRCPVCRFERKAEPEVELEPVHDGEPTEQDRLQAAFQKRYRGILAEREEQQAARAKAAEPVKLAKTRAEKAAEFLVGGQVIARGD